MPRNARNLSSANYFHVISQGLNREKIFGNSALKHVYLDNIAAAKELYPSVAAITFCVMDNHCHLLLYTPDVPTLSAFMRRVNTRFAQYYNFKNDRVGYVFRNRYASQEIADTNYLTRCFVYINNNPVRAGIVQDAEEYVHSGLKDYIARSSRIIDFAKAEEFFDISPDNIRALSTELTATDLDCPVWLESDEDSVSAQQLVSDAVAASGVDLQLLPHAPEALSRVCTYLLKAGLPRYVIAENLGIDRHKLCQICKAYD